MNTFVKPLALALAMTVPAGYAAASDDDDHGFAPCDNWQTIAQIAEKYTSAGYDIREIEMENGGYEIEAIDQQGKRVELLIDPVTGEKRGEERDDEDSDD